MDATFSHRADPQAPAETSRNQPRRFRWVIDAIWPLSLAIMASICVLLPTALSTEGRISLFVFALAAILWTTTSLNASYVALAAVVLLIIAGGAPQEQLFSALASDVVWLMIGAFVIGGVVNQTGLGLRMTDAVIGRRRNVGTLFWLLSAVLLPLSFFVPSTSGRAAITMPVFRSIAESTDDPRIVRALALLIPTIILVTTIVSIIGAGSHLIANDLLYQISGQRVSFAQWALYGVPFGVLAGGVSCWLITRMFLSKAIRQRIIDVPRRATRGLRTDEHKTIAVAAGMIALWLSESWHGFSIATVTVTGALVLTLPGFGVLAWKDALRSVSWNLLVFVGAALVLGRALINSGAAQWIIDNLISLSGIISSDSQLPVLLAIAFVTLTSHLYMTSHSARAAALIPALIYFGNSLELNPVAVMFIATVGMNYCLTFPVSSKALLMFQELDETTFQPSDLLRLSSVLILVHLALMLVFYFGYWQWIGLSL